MGDFYLALDYIFFFGQMFGLLMIIFSSFFLFNEIEEISFAKVFGQLTYRINFLFLTIALLLWKYESTIEPSSARDTESTLYVTEIAYIFGILSVNDLTRLLLQAITPVQIIISDSF